MLFDTIQNRHKPYSFTSLLKTRLISAVVTLIIHGIVLVLLLFVVPLVQVNVFEEEVVNVFIAPGDPLIFPDREGINTGTDETDELESDMPEGEDPQGISKGSGIVGESIEGEDKLREDSVPSTSEESSPSSPLVSEFRLDKRRETTEETDSAKGPLLILSFPESRKVPLEKAEILPGKVVDFNKYLEPEFPHRSGIVIGRRMGEGSLKLRGQQARAIIKGTKFDVTPWASVVVERIQKNWIIPSDRENPAQGRVGVDVKISKKGDLVEIQLIESSLIEPFDLAALSAVKDSAPFPSLPGAYPGLVIQIYFIFHYND
jgi:TonB family protein